MSTAKNEVWIAAPQQRVFDYVANLTKHGEWSTHKLRVEQEGAGPVGEGTRFISHGEQFGVPITDTLTVIDYEPGRRFVFESAGKDGRWRHSYELEPENGGTRLTRTMSPGSLLLRLASPVINLGLPKRNAADLQRLKQKLESR